MLTAAPQSTAAGCWLDSGRQQKPTEQVRAETLEAIGHVATGRSAYAESGIQRLVTRSREPGHARVITRELASLLRELLRAAWMAGWRPLDLTRHVERHLDARHVPILGDAMAGDATLFARTDVVEAAWAIVDPILVLTTGSGVHSFTLDREMGSFILTERNLTIPPDTQEFAVNLSNMRHWEAPMRRYIDELLAGKTGPRGRDFNMRWVASMVADVHRILTRGGIFMYPRDVKDSGKPGKLRLMYEANPMAMIVEQAGGAATTGLERILDLQPTGLHQRVPVMLGSKNEVERVASYHQK